MKRISHDEVKWDLLKRGYSVCENEVTGKGVHKKFDTKRAMVAWYRKNFIEWDRDIAIQARLNIQEALGAVDILKDRQAHDELEARAKNLDLMIASEGHPVTRERVIQVLKKAGYECGKYETTRVRGWHEYNGDFKVMDSVDGSVWCVVLWSYSSKKELLEKFHKVLVKAGLNATLREHEVWVSKIPSDLDK